MTSSMFYGTQVPEKTQAYLDEIIDHGSIFVARVDGKELLPEHVQALVAYLASKGSNYSDDTAVGMDEYMDLLSKEDFVEFWATWVGEHPDAKGLPSPYEV